MSTAQKEGQRSDVSRITAGADDDSSKPGRLLAPLTRHFHRVRWGIGLVMVAIVCASGWWYWQGGKDAEVKSTVANAKTKIGSFFGHDSTFGHDATTNQSEADDKVSRPEIMVGETKGREISLNVIHRQEVPEGTKDPIVKDDKIIIYVPQELIVGEGATEPKIETDPETGHLVVAYCRSHVLRAYESGSVQEVLPEAKDKASKILEQQQEDSATDSSSRVSESVVTTEKKANANTSVAGPTLIKPNEEASKTKAAAPAVKNANKLPGTSGKPQFPAVSRPDGR